ncbi:MAG: hypothetical protein PVG32_12745 [Anaerolineales bacterium]|jgi:hypothetical protein
MENVSRLAKEMALYCRQRVEDSVPAEHCSRAMKNVRKVVLAALLIGGGMKPNRGKGWTKAPE